VARISSPIAKLGTVDVPVVSVDNKELARVDHHDVAVGSSVLRVRRL
jgi:hypothetical protein